MKPTRSMVLRIMAGCLMLLLAGLLFVQFISTSSGVDTSGVSDQSRNDKINLALRRTAHHLLRAAGDSTSRIMPVQQPTPQTFQIQLSRAFDYDRLPGLLQQSFRLHRVMGAYDVAVLDCATSTLQLGYTVSDLAGRNSVPCGGRTMHAGCYTLQVTFDAPPISPQRAGFGWLLVAGGLLIGFLYVVWPRSSPVIYAPTEPIEPNTEQLYFGNTQFDVNRQVVMSGVHQHNLTYREAKLLRLFVNHTNQVLEREVILKSVWEDEGITVGRSVDVFVSRLRKLLQNDPAIRIMAVHGVGYRLEVRTDV